MYFRAPIWRDARPAGPNRRDDERAGACHAQHEFDIAASGQRRTVKEQHPELITSCDDSLHLRLTAAGRLEVRRPA
jgi:hypothetical protein